MPSFDVVVETACSSSVRARQLEAIFDVPRTPTSRLQFKGELPIDSDDWHVGLIVGPSGSGKSTILRDVFGDEKQYEWNGASVIDDFAAALSMDEISDACQSVGFNTIPAWLRPFKVLSNGERFRVELARRMLESGDDVVVVDEFTSVVDRQVAQIGSHAVQKYIRRTGKKFVGASCHYDIIEWLQPDWILDPSTMDFQRRSLRRRPTVDCEVSRVPYSTWAMFAPFHYMSNELHRAARCYGLFVAGRIAAFAGVMFRPHPKVRNIVGLSRVVTLPDFQGLGLAFHLMDRLASAYAAKGFRFHTYPAHPELIRSFDRSTVWRLEKRPGVFSAKTGSTSTLKGKTLIHQNVPVGVGSQGGRPCAVFEWVGPPMEDADLAVRLTS